MLRDLKRDVNRVAFERRRRTELPQAFGNFITSLADWDWFLNPITFRDRSVEAEKPEPVSPSFVKENPYRVPPDSRIALWRPHSRGSQDPGPPVPAAALAALNRYLGELQSAAGTAIGWMIAEEFGATGGRYHCHGLICGVGHLRRDSWWRIAHERFGRTRISPFDPARGAAFYAAKYAAKQLGEIHFGGTLKGVDLARLEDSTAPVVGRQVIAHSDSLPRQFFRMTYARRHK